MEKRGIHIIGDLHNCDLRALATSRSKVKPLIKKVENKIKKVGLTNLGSVSYYFGPNAITATVMLAESHVAFHTWPELNFTSLDVFVCNFTKDNTPLAEKIFLDLALSIFKSKSIKKKVLKH